MSLIVISLLGLVAVLYLRAVHHSIAVRREWQFICSLRSASAFEGIEIKAASEGAAIRSAYRSAMAARSAGSREEALRLVDALLRIIERATPGWIDTLAYVSIVARMADAVVPIQPMRPWVFRLFPLAWLSLVGMIAHHVTITTGERLRLRAYVLRGSWRLLRRRMRSNSKRIHEGDSERVWDGLGAVRDDFAMVSEETLRSLYAALLSLDARPAGAVAQTAGR
jgi:hypothetical protein